jgi:hypothetical protein
MSEIQAVQFGFERLAGLLELHFGPIPLRDQTF